MGNLHCTPFHFEKFQIIFNFGLIDIIFSTAETIELSIFNNKKVTHVKTLYCNYL